MATYTDAEGRTYPVRITIGALRAIRANAAILDDFDPIKIVSMSDSDEINKLLDPIVMGTLIWILVADEAEKIGIDADQFDAAFTGDAIPSAAEAFLEAFADFCPSPQRRQLRAILTKTREMQPELDKAVDRSIEMINAMDPKSLISMDFSEIVTAPVDSSESIRPG